jgi:hypothetical protein
MLHVPFADALQVGPARAGNLAVPVVSHGTLAAPLSLGTPSAR